MKSTNGIDDQIGWNLYATNPKIECDFGVRCIFTQVDLVYLTGKEAMRKVVQP